MMTKLFRSSLTASIVILTLAALFSSAALGADNTYRFNQALDQVMKDINGIKMDRAEKSVLCIELTQALTDNHQRYPDRVMDPKEISGVVKESIGRKNSVEKTVSAAYAVDLARKMNLTPKQVAIVRRVFITGEGNLKKEGIPQAFMDALAANGQIEKPECCQTKPEEGKGR